jgi:hypothetical protein
MNALYESRLAGPVAFGCLTCGANLGDLGDTSAPSDAVAILNGILDGSMAKTLKDQRRTQSLLISDLENTAIEIRKMPSGDAKNKATAIISEAQKTASQASQKLNEAINKHNNIARSIQTFSMNKLKPPMAGLGDLGEVVLTGTGLIIAGVIAVPLLYLLSDLIKSVFGLQQTSKSLGAQAEGILKEFGGVVVGGAKFTYEMTTLIALVVGGYFAFQIWQGARPARRASYSPPSPSFKPAAITGD